MLDNLWQVDFLLDAGDKGVQRRDAVYVSLCVAHAVMLLAHGWHAAAGRWVVNEKGLIPGVSRLPIDCGHFSRDAAAILGAIGGNSSELRHSIETARRLPRPAA